MIATDDYVEAHFPLHTMHENYFDFCTNVMDIPLDQCKVWAGHAWARNPQLHGSPGPGILIYMGQP